MIKVLAQPLNWLYEIGDSRQPRTSKSENPADLIEATWTASRLS